MHEHTNSALLISGAWFCRIPSFSCFFIAVLVLLPLAGATPYPAVMGGRVIGMDATNQTLTIVADCDQFACSSPMTGVFEGKVTNDAVSGTILPGDTVELMYRSWMGQYPCETGDFKGMCTVPGHMPIPVGTWAGISRVVQEPGTGRWLITDLFGDPDESPVQFIHNYSLTYEPGPDTATCPVDQPVWECDAGYVNITLMQMNRTIEERRVMRNTSFSHEESGNQTQITLMFLGGKATPGHIASPGGCPCTDMEVHVRPAPARPEPDPQQFLTRAPVPATQPAPLPLPVTIMAAGLAGFLVISWMRRPE